MAVVWDILHGAPDYSFYAIQGQILVDGGLAAGSTTTEFTLEAGDGSKMTLRGTFVLNGDDVESGTINRIDFVDADGTLVAKATGYTGGDAIDVVEFFAALADVANDPFVTLYSALVGGMPSTFNGSDDNDLIVDTDWFANAALGNTLFGNGGGDNLYGYDGNDELHGGGGKDNLYGVNGDDKLFGDGGHDEMFAGNGNDKLTGGGGRDYFIFQEALDAANNVDKYVDFKANEVIVLYDSFMQDIGDEGRLDGGRLRIGTEAKDGNDRVIYDSKSGKLYYDQDGDGNTFEQVLFAKVDKHLKLDAGSFEVVAI